MNTIWTKTDLTRDELNEKRVEFRLLRGNEIHVGHGEIWVRQNPEGLLAIDLVTEVQGSHQFERKQTRYHLAQAEVEYIQRHPDSSVGEFLVVTAP